MESQHFTDEFIGLIREPREMPNFYHSHTNILILNRVADILSEQKFYQETFEKVEMAVQEQVLNNTFKDKYVPKLHAIGLEVLYQYLEYLRANGRIKDIHKVVQIKKDYKFYRMLSQMGYNSDYINNMILLKYYTLKESQDLDKNDALEIRSLLSDRLINDWVNYDMKDVKNFKAAQLFIKVFHNLIQFDQSKHLNVAEVSLEEETFYSITEKFKEAQKDFMDRFEEPYVGGQKVYYQGNKKARRANDENWSGDENWNGDDCWPGRGKFNR
eukprot:403366690